MRLGESKEQRKKRGLVGRRELLQLGVAGVAGAVLGSRTAVAQEPGTGGGQPSPPPTAELIDPAGLQAETWLEPWTWRPEDWPGEALDLHVVENPNPGPRPSIGNPFSRLYSYGGVSPAPTIRVRGDGTLRVKLRNFLGLDQGRTRIGPSPDAAELPPALTREICKRIEEAPPDQTGFGCGGRLFFDPPEPFYDIARPRWLPGWGVVDHVNGTHSAHVTNLHTHGLHVAPNLNRDGSNSDNVLLRLLSRPSWQARQRLADPRMRELGLWEQVGEADFTFDLGNVMRRTAKRRGLAPQPQPPGTHWYHPHAHGSTHDQVSSGMAGFLILEGDVDDALNQAMTGSSRPDPEVKTGDWDYRERLMLFQRVEMPSLDRDAAPRRQAGFRFPLPLSLNGIRSPGVLFMRPGAVERWRVLNGSVDGRGFKRFMVVRGQYFHDRRGLWRVEQGPQEGERRLVAVTRQEIEEAKLPLYQLAHDGITLVKVERGKARYAIKDLSKVNAGSQHPLAKPPRAGEDPDRAMLRNVEDCYRDGRGDPRLLGAAPTRSSSRPTPIVPTCSSRRRSTAQDEVYTILAQEVLVHTDNFQQRLQYNGSASKRDQKGDVATASRPDRRLRPRARRCRWKAWRFRRDEPGRRMLPPVPPFLEPIGDDELRMPGQTRRGKSKRSRDGRLSQSASSVLLGLGEDSRRRSMEVPDELRRRPTRSSSF